DVCDSLDDVSVYLMRFVLLSVSFLVVVCQGFAHIPTKDSNDLDAYLDDPDSPTKEYVLLFDQFEDLVSFAHLFRPV
ncbi:adaptor protein MecA, partial [Lactobacillus sp. CRM56-2]|nr:adaptor protein MecA [Lactobacillus sp. CRM56-2]